MPYWLQVAHKMCAKSTHRWHQVGAVIERGGNIISKAANSHKWHCCAERRAIRPHMDYTGATIYVCRSNLRVSRPCEDCQKILKKSGIKYVVYIDREGRIQKEKIDSFP